MSICAPDAIRRAALVAAPLALAALVALELAPVAEGLASAEPLQAAAPSATPAPSGPPIEDLAQLVLERPVFTPGRRPPAPPEPPEAPEAEAAPRPEWRWRLAGTMVGAGRREALLV